MLRQNRIPYIHTGTNDFTFLKQLRFCHQWVSLLKKPFRAVGIVKH